MEEEKVVVTVHGKQYDLTRYIDIHPGGRAILLKMNGLDATEEFEKGKHSSKTKRLMAQFRVYAEGEAPDPEPAFCNCL